ncbi:ATP-binding protein [Celeribacter neptunius]|uniref:Transcriptional regulator, LuxR family n=1 Tax=Celeribacter neptunius TaxID=588602 RepID=A0A1I3V643_9RHOB|nr:AAA family ATPase [Celeribacter neptunius]SFJ91054.1 transcriptional regulator, LuxR family [Celeribacter neptunius]
MKGTGVLFERDENLQAILTAFAAVPEGGGQMVQICGEAGMGKSTLIDAALSRLAGQGSTATGYCDPLATPRPLGPVRDIAAALCPPDRHDVQDTWYFDGLITEFLTSKRPLILVLEDLHWVDERTLDWLIFMGRRLTMLPVLILCSFRDTEVHATHPLRTALGSIPARRKTQVDLAPLSRDAVRQMAETGGLSADRLLEITGGNPFFLTEMLAHADDPGDVPHSIADAFNARLNRMPPEVVGLLEEAACWPRTIPHWSLQQDQAVLSAAVEQGLLVPAKGGMTFRHELARLAIYDRLPAPRRIEAHGHFLARLTEDATAERSLDLILHHALGAQNDEMILRYAPQAAEQAATLGAHREAADFFAHALQRAGQLQPEISAEIHERWAYESGLSRAMDTEVIAAREHALALWQALGRTDRAGENLRWLSRIHWYRGESEKAEQRIHQALDLLNTEGPSPAKAWAFALRAQYFMLKDHMGEAIDWGQRAIALAREIGDDEILVHALNTTGSAMLFRGDLEGEALLRQSLSLALEHGFHEDAARVYTNLSECLIELRALARADALIEAGIAFDSGHDLDSWTYYLVGRKAQLRFEQDRYEDTIRIARDVLARENLTLLMRMPALICLARALIRLGDATADTVLSEALEAAERIGEPQYIVPLLVAEIERAILTNAPDRTGVAEQRLAGIDPAQLSPRKRGEVLFWLHIAGRGGRNAAPDALPAPFRHLLEGRDEAAHTALLDEGSAYLAAWLRLISDRPGAMAEADRAFRTFGTLAARRFLRNRPGAEHQALPPIERGPYRAARAHPYGLTAKEQIVLGHLVEGRSNAAIAEAMNRSRRTVENHISTILSKLQVKNRIEVLLRVKSEPSILAAQTTPKDGGTPD